MDIDHLMIMSIYFYFFCVLPTNTTTTTTNTHKTAQKAGPRPIQSDEQFAINECYGHWPNIECFWLFEILFIFLCVLIDFFCFLCCFMMYYVIFECVVMINLEFSFILILAKFE